MTKAEIVAQISEKTGIERVAVATIIEETMVTIKDSLTHGENVYLRGFGTFGIIERKEKLARNITKNTAMVVPAHKIPKFKPSKEFMGMVK